MLRLDLGCTSVELGFGLLYLTFVRALAVALSLALLAGIGGISV